MSAIHSFHIPVMGIGFTVDTPLKVSQYGIDSAISLVDDILLEKLRKMYCGKFKLPYKEISDKIEDFRAKRITSYLNLIHELSQRAYDNFLSITTETAKGVEDFIAILSDTSALKREFQNLIGSQPDLDVLKKWFREHMTMGSIDVNIMTKVDKDNYIKKTKLPTEFNDAHAALRGYALSDLSSTLILSAGMNPRLYGYMENFEDFYPDGEGHLRKKIALKVSDYRSALVQGKFLAKKGLWISEYRIESGLNCGGHAFATDGYLMGPILDEFKANREGLAQELHKLLAPALAQKGRSLPNSPLPIKITAQGGVGTAEEHTFLLDHYQVDSVGWGTPFLLVPEATTVDKATRERLMAATEEDLYLSQISPLGIPFHSLRGNTKDLEKQGRINKGKPGSPCPKKFVALNKEFKESGLCTASRQYQHKKIRELDALQLPPSEYQVRYDQITEKSCTCVGLGTSALLAYGLDTKTEGPGVSICPGPNMAFFSKETTLNGMIDHIYGRNNLIERTDRPPMFIKELALYIDYLKEQIDRNGVDFSKAEYSKWQRFAANLEQGMAYYEKLEPSGPYDYRSYLANIRKGINALRPALCELNAQLAAIAVPA